MRVVLVKVVYGFLLSQLQVVPPNGKRARTNGRTLAMSAERTLNLKTETLKYKILDKGNVLFYIKPG